MFIIERYELDLDYNARYELESILPFYFETLEKAEVFVSDAETYIGHNAYLKYEIVKLIKG